jgi:hypothetical protein
MDDLGISLIHEESLIKQTISKQSDLQNLSRDPKKQSIITSVFPELSPKRLDFCESTQDGG